MKVARLEIFGFKSFMDRLVLPLDAGVTGVVGPNGCGKSNIVDAIRWVLGETRARSLRGESLEDVIFNGTDNLRPLGLAEVTLTLRASSESFFSDLVSPELEAEELARAADELEQQAEALPAVIARATGELQESPEPPTPTEPQPSEPEVAQDADRPQLRVIDGALSEKRTNPETPAAAPASSSFLAKFSWLRSASEVQVTRRLYRSGESEFFINRVPCRLKDMKDLFRGVGLGARAYTVVAQGEVSRIISARPEEVRVLIEEAAGVSGLREKVSNASKRLAETLANVTRLDDVMKEVGRQVNSLKRQAQRAMNRKALKDEIAQLEQRLFVDQWARREATLQGQESGVVEARGAEELAKTAVDAARAVEEEARAALLTLDVEGDAVRGKVESIQEELTQRAVKRARLESRLAELKAFQSSVEGEGVRLNERRETLQQRASEILLQVEQLRGDERGMEEQIRLAEGSKQGSLEELAEAMHQAQLALRSKEDDLRKHRELLVAAEARLRTCREQLVAASPVTELKRSLGEGVVRKLCEGARLFVEGLTVPTEYERAVQAILGERAQFLLSDRAREIAAGFVDELGRMSGQKREGLGLGVFQSGEASLTPWVTTLATPSVVPLLSLIQVEPSFARAAHQVFGGVLFAESLAEAWCFFDDKASLLPIGHGPIVVTRDGDVLTAESFLSFRHEGGLVRMKNEVTRLAEESEELRKGSGLRQEAVDAARGELNAATQRYNEALREQQRRQAELRELGQRLGGLRGRIQAEERSRSQIEHDARRIDEQQGELRSKLARYAEEQSQVEKEMVAISGADDTPLREELARLKEEEARIESVRRAGRSRLSERANEVNQRREALDAARQEVSLRTLALDRARLERDNDRNRVVQHFGEGTAEEWIRQAAQGGDGVLLGEEQQRESKHQLLRLKDRIVREGDVDPSSIEQYEVENRRLEELTGQRADLDRAVSTLQRTIDRLTDTSRERFLSTFELVRDNFARLVPRLFGGGKGSLDILDPAHPLESGIGITIRPPGKKPNGIERLSGGEKALSAIGLIVSLFLVRPSPLCVLDEVDAPLDEANLVRFLSLIKDMSTKTQFIMITHNKQSMSASDRLVGVTQQQPGASQIVTVSLQEAYSQVA